ncbi:hypothetical protein ACIBAH_33895 [Streptomyces sp. NPDC051445]|uniref:hypothetical protein n=1 Tax=Streptomyces sp. NPDC051445 TaxID=3365653 RepID=UPI0037BCE9F4
MSTRALKPPWHPASHPEIDTVTSPGNHWRIEQAVTVSSDFETCRFPSERYQYNPFEFLCLSRLPSATKLWQTLTRLPHAWRAECALAEYDENRVL